MAQCCRSGPVMDCAPPASILYSGSDPLNKYLKSAGFIIAMIDALPDWEPPVISRATTHLNVGIPRRPLLL